jgi:hypothetical protein
MRFQEKINPNHTIIYDLCIGDHTFLSNIQEYILNVDIHIDIIFCFYINVSISCRQCWLPCLICQDCFFEAQTFKFAAIIVSILIIFAGQNESISLKTSYTNNLSTNFSNNY